MADRLTISLWLNEWDEDSILVSLRKLLEFFPYSRQYPGVWAVSVHPLDWTEPPSLERTFPECIDAEECIEAVREFEHADCAYQVEVFWDIGEQPHKVNIIAYAPDFEGRDDYQGHIELELGDDTAFRAARENITQLVFLLAELPKRLKLRKRLLWAESGEDVSQLLIPKK